MRKPHLHPLSSLLDAFLDPLGEKFKRNYDTTNLTPPVVAISVLMMVLNVTSFGYMSVMRHLRMMRPDLVKVEPSESAFCRARKKITEAMFEACWKSFQSRFQQLLGPVLPTAFGYQLVAIDGVWFNGRRSKTLFRALRKKKRGRPVKDPKGQPQMLVVVLVDALTRTPIAKVSLMPGQGERTAAKQLVKYLGTKTILLADRGFPSRELLQMLGDYGVKYVIRTKHKTGAFSEVRDCLERHASKDQDLEMALGKGKNKKWHPLRLVTGKPRNHKDKDSGKGEQWTLITNLPRNSRWTRAVILDLYYQRWSIETFFRELKSILHVDQFHSHSLEGMQQEISMAMLSGALVAAAEILSLTRRGKAFPRWNNPTQARCNRATLLTTIHCLLSLPATLSDLCERIDEALGISEVRARKRKPERSFPRICKSFQGKWRSGFKRKAG